MSAADLWYKDAVFYELHVKAFYDGNGDGIGDFRGLMEKLDYVQDLGVDCLWILPFYPVAAPAMMATTSPIIIDVHPLLWDAG